MVDDEEEARFALADLLKEFDQIEILGSTGNPDEVVRLVHQEHPDIIFLDIDMPGKSGLHLAAEINRLNLNTIIVFVTGFDKYALEAFRVSAVAYLLKPVTNEMMKDVLEKIEKSGRDAHSKTRIDSLVTYLNNAGKIRLNTKEGFKLIKPETILYFQAEGSYSRGYTHPAQELLISSNLAQLEELLTSFQFFRINRNILINLAHLTHVDRSERTVTLSNGEYRVELNISGERLKYLDLYLR